MFLDTHGAGLLFPSGVHYSGMGRQKREPWFPHTRSGKSAEHLLCQYQPIERERERERSRGSATAPTSRRSRMMLGSQSVHQSAATYIDPRPQSR